MGFFQNLLGIEPDNSVNKVDAAVAPYNYQQYAQPFDYFGLSAVYTSSGYAGSGGGKSQKHYLCHDRIITFRS
jgi:hypothetical protein